MSDEDSHERRWTAMSAGEAVNDEVYHRGG